MVPSHVALLCPGHMSPLSGWLVLLLLLLSFAGSGFSGHMSVYWHLVSVSFLSAFGSGFVAIDISVLVVFAFACAVVLLSGRADVVHVDVPWFL